MGDKLQLISKDTFLLDHLIALDVSTKIDINNVNEPVSSYSVEIDTPGCACEVCGAVGYVGNLRWPLQQPIIGIGLISTLQRHGNRRAGIEIHFSWNCNAPTPSHLRSVLLRLNILSFTPPLLNSGHIRQCLRFVRWFVRFVGANLRPVGLQSTNWHANAIPFSGSKIKPLFVPSSYQQVRPWLKDAFY